MLLFAVLLINAGAGAFFVVGAFMQGGVRPVPFALASVPPLLGFAGAGLMLRYPVTGLVLGIFFYAIQTVSYANPEGIWGIRSGFNVGYSVPYGTGVLSVNVLAVILGIAHAVIAFRRHVRSKGTSGMSTTAG